MKRPFGKSEFVAKRPVDGTQTTRADSSGMSGLMIESMGCPNCGAPFDHKGRICEYCGSTLIVSSMAETFSRTVEGHQINQAIEKWRERLKQDPNSPEAHYAIGLTYLNAKLRDQAIEHLQQAAHFAPESSDIHYTLSLALFNDGNILVDSIEWDQAMEEMAVASQLSPNFRDAAAYNHYFVARQLDDLNPEGAISEYIKSTEVSPDLPLVWNNMGICYLAIDRHEDAYTCLKHAVTLSNNNLFYCGNFATTSHHLARYDEGIEWSKWAVSLYDPTRHTKEEGAEAYSWLFELLFEKGMANGVDPIILEEAYQAISNAYALNPNESRHNFKYMEYFEKILPEAV